jgi:phosphoribosylanthranilate isomerase
MRTRIKFCGMTRAADVAAAAALGADAVGLVFAAGSPRRLEPGQATGLRAAAAPFLSVVALFRDTPEAEIAAALEMARPHLLQFHGDEDEAACARWGLPYLRAVPMGSLDAGGAAAWLARYPSAAGFVFDSHAAGGAGGSGGVFDWSRLPAAGTQPWLLAGGLTPETVADAVQRVRPWGVDVASGIEARPGIKDPQRMHRFVTEVRRADASDTD